jgi:redox-sensitive bicupin YhaK (pirin superfamily)
VQTIRPGAVNWMTAGRGIVHSERTPAGARTAGATLAGLQTWVALPREAEEAEPSFAHTPAEALPALEGDGVRARVVLGALFGARSPVRVFSETVYADLALEPGARVQLPADHEERAVYVAAGDVEEAGATFPAGQLLVLRAGAPVVLRAAAAGARLVLLGGAAMDGPRHVFWNFVSSRPERIEQAAADWAEGRFAAVPGETEAIPLPSRPRLVAYP